MLSLVNLSMPDQLAAYIHGDIDGMTIADPFTLKAELAGAKLMAKWYAFVRARPCWGDKFCEDPRRSLGTYQLYKAESQDSAGVPTRLHRRDELDERSH